MAKYYDASHTFGEYLLLPNFSSSEHVPDAVCLNTPLVKYARGETPALELKAPLASAVMQAVSDHALAIALARCGGISFIFVSQPIDEQAAMVSEVKRFKAGFVVSDSNITPDTTLGDVLTLAEKTGHTTMPVTDDGTPYGKLLGILTSRDYRVSRVELTTPVRDLMTPFEMLVTGQEGVSLTEANDLIWQHKLNCLPVIDQNGRLRSLVFRKDYEQSKANPRELTDGNKRLMVGFF